MVVTLDTGAIVPKDEAARRVERLLPSPDGRLLAMAREGYLGEVADDWTTIPPQQVRAVAEALATLVRRAYDAENVSDTS